MRVLVVANYNRGSFSPFVIEQTEALLDGGVEIEYFGIIGKGPLGYLKNLPRLQRAINEFKPDLIHAHYGMSGLLATLQRRVPVVVTFHGSDIHSGGINLAVSRLCLRRSAYNIFVTEALHCASGFRGNNYMILPCGIDDDVIKPMEKAEARHLMGWNESEKVVLFSGAFDREVKNAPLAKDAVSLLDGVRLQELKGFSRVQVRYALNACDCLLMTSHNEGSPQIIKEAMACNTPIVSVPVGDVESVIGSTDGCLIAQFSTEDIAEKLSTAMRFGKTKGRDIIISKGLTNKKVANTIMKIYSQVLPPPPVNILTICDLQSHTADDRFSCVINNLAA